MTNDNIYDKFSDLSTSCSCTSVFSSVERKSSMFQQLKIFTLFLLLLKTVISSELLNLIDLSFIDEAQVCQINLQYAEFNDTQLEKLMQNSNFPHFTSFSKSSELCKNSLILQPIQKLQNDLESISECKERMHFVKDPFSSLIFYYQK